MAFEHIEHVTPEAINLTLFWAIEPKWVNKKMDKNKSLFITSEFGVVLLPNLAFVF